MPTSSLQHPYLCGPHNHIYMNKIYNACYKSMSSVKWIQVKGLWLRPGMSRAGLPEVLTIALMVMAEWEGLSYLTQHCSNC